MSETARYKSHGGRRRAVLFVALALVIATVLFGGGWYAASEFVSPAQRAATAMPPRPKAITGTVTRGSLSQTVSAAATVQSSTQTVLQLTNSSARAVVTDAPVHEGSLITTPRNVVVVNGRPVIAVTGTFPFYRDLAPSMKGPDVSQLQGALASAGFAVKQTGLFDLATVLAVKALYKRIGYSAPSSNGVPLDEILVVPSREVTVVDAPTVGTLLTADTAMTFASGGLVAQAQVTPSLTDAIRAGMATQLQAADGKSLAATVSSVQAAQKDGDNAIVTLVPTTGTLPSAWTSESVIAMIQLKKIAGESLIVPSASISNMGQDDAYVLKREADGTFHEVTVREIAELNGMSAVTPTTADALAVGDTVRVD